MGLGLSIARTIVEAHGGTIRAENGVGEGAVFIMELPSAPTQGAGRWRGAAHERRRRSSTSSRTTTR